MNWLACWTAGKTAVASRLIGDRHGLPFPPQCPTGPPVLQLWQERPQLDFLGRTSGIVQHPSRPFRRHPRHGGAARQGVSWSVEHSPEGNQPAPASLLTGPAEGLSDSRRFRPGPLEAFKQGYLGCCLSSCSRPGSQGQLLWELNLSFYYPTVIAASWCSFPFAPFPASIPACSATPPPASASRPFAFARFCHSHHRCLPPSMS